MIQNRVLLFLTICFVTPSLSNFCQKIISFQFFEMGVTSLPPIWTMSLNILFVFLDVTPYSPSTATTQTVLQVARKKYEICFAYKYQVIPGIKVPPSHPSFKAPPHGGGLSPCILIQPTKGWNSKLIN